MKPFGAIEWVFELVRTAAPGARWPWERRLAVVVAWGLGMVTVAATPTATAEPMAVATSEASRPARAPALEVIGVSFTADDGVGTTQPIYSVVVGDPRAAEERAYAWSGRFGMYALDANLWTRVTPTSNAWWRLTILHRPRTAKEVEAFAETPGAFKVEVFGGAGLLPVPFRHLAERELSSIEYVVHYFLGGTRAELRGDATRADAEALLDHIVGQMKRQ